MAVFLIINLFIYVILTIYYPIYLTRYFHLSSLNPIVISFLFYAPVILFKTFIGPMFALENGILNIYFNYAILMSNIDLIIKLLITSLLLRTFHRRHIDSKIINLIAPKWKISAIRMKRASSLCLFFFFICFILLASHSYGIVNWIISPRTGYQLYRSGAGVFYALSLLFLSTSFALRLIYTIRFKSIFIWTLFYLFLVWFMGSKGFLLDFAIFYFIILWFKNYRHLNRLIKIGIPAIFAILLMNFGSINIEDITAYFDYYVNSAHYYEEYFNGGIDLFNGEILLSNFWSLVPRIIYPEKPYVYGFLLVNEHFFPGAAEATNTPAFGGPIESFADFGIIGIVISSVFNFTTWFNVFCNNVIFKSISFEQIQSNPILIYIVLILFAPSFMTFIEFPLSFFVFLFLMGGISICNRVVVKNI